MNTLQTEDNVMILDVGKSLRTDAKMTAKKRKLLLESLANEFNITRACRSVGITVQGFYKLLSNDEKFNAAFEEVKFAYLHEMQSVSFKVGLDPTHKGYNDRKMQFQAFMPQLYNPRQEIDLQVSINNTNYTQEMRRILSQYVTSRDKAVTTTYRNINENNNLKEK